MKRGSFCNMEKDKVRKLNKSKLESPFDREKGLNNELSWKEWKIQRKKEFKEWKEKKLLKQLSKKAKKSLNKSEANSISTENLRSESEVASNHSENLTNESKAKSKRTENLKHDYTISIAVPGSILDNAQSPELKTYLAGQVARAAAVFRVNEVIVYSEQYIENLDDLDFSLKMDKKHHGCVQLVRILQFLECPQYLRKHYFPIHKDLEYAGLLNPLDIPHHLRVGDYCKYREGTVMNKPVKEGKGSYVYIGLKKSAVIDKVLEPNIRVTVQLNEEQNSQKHFKGKAVSPLAPLKHDNIYWGYNVRLARGLAAVFSESTFKGGYDLTIGTSDKGSEIDTIQLPTFKHLLIVFGGLKGIEAALEADESMMEENPKELFHHYLNTCPDQGSRTIRTEEAMLITLSSLRPKIAQAQNSTTDAFS